VVLLSGAYAGEAAGVLTRLQEATPYGQTFSAGVARWDRHETPEALLNRADQALYRAKDDGRNRIVVDSAVHA
jgi:PleD family two-component response regulator